MESPPRDVAPDQPEILAVDLTDEMPIKEMLMWVVPDKVKEWTCDLDTFENEGEHVFQVPNTTNYWVTVIPVVAEEDRRVIQSCLMCNCMKDTKIIILKLAERRASDHGHSCICCICCQ